MTRQLDYATLLSLYGCFFRLGTTLHLIVCSCRVACNETEYELTISSATYPAENYEDFIPDMVREGSLAVRRTLATWLNTSESALKSGAECLIEKSYCTNDSYDFTETSDDNTFFQAVQAGRSTFSDQCLLERYEVSRKQKLPEGNRESDKRKRKTLNFGELSSGVGGMFGPASACSSAHLVDNRVLELPVLLLRLSAVWQGCNKVDETQTTMSR
ncbi:PREDICTED: uncharacterized protein LOC106814304 [Priapulus caudatus]|uniref:Uncharacterized protein LOC106814304 n=1 Tax=Priapulus caudatus TaxID=37621 RepID=A0ABM1EPH0_PRICU|nr:PREDICTED: uncharacterized protein LOC106814304 [Priapulus caudatus]